MMFPKRSKYGNVRTHGFDSKGEYERYLILRDKERRGEISGLTRQVPYQLIPDLRDDNGKLLFKGIVYKADFTYWKDGKFVVEDFKGVKTKEYRIKQKLLYYFYHLTITESGKGKYGRNT